VNTIPNNTVLLVSQYNAYVSCQENNKYNYITGCADTCPAMTAIYKGGNECLNYKALGKYLSNGFIVNECPTNTFSDEFNICNTCKQLKQFLYINKCVDSCPSNSYPSYTLNICSTDNCRDVNGIIYDDSCVDKCPAMTVLDMEKNKCLFGFNFSIGTTCEPNPCKNNGVCSIDIQYGTDAICDCTPEWIGPLCSLEISKSFELFNQITDEISNLNSTTPITSNQLNTLLVYSDLLKANSTLITTQLSDTVYNMLNDQIHLIEDGSAKPQPKFIKTLDMLLYINL